MTKKFFIKHIVRTWLKFMQKIKNFWNGSPKVDQKPVEIFPNHLNDMKNQLVESYLIILIQIDSKFQKEQTQSKHGVTTVSDVLRILNSRPVSRIRHHRRYGVDVNNNI